MKQVEEKRIMIYVVGGNVKVVSKPHDILLDIVDFDNLEEYVEPAFTGILY
ncbi:hypothetical protein [Bacillus thuringiensis]|uniref:hypothetical protein n=1 Tax=Bacillus thuringiensis TaxID=1428 RepID=UPI002DB7C1A4|nr:hypothetical protein [Bacillus thuringiensis]MEC3454348.1 hypothetical protein [Bacillus thuringiensis]